MNKFEIKDLCNGLVGAQFALSNTKVLVQQKGCRDGEHENEAVRVYAR